MSQELNKFLSQFQFQPSLAGYIGIEREQFLCQAHFDLLTLSLIVEAVPLAQEFLSYASSAFTYELSACQVEDRTPPAYFEQAIARHLKENDLEALQIARSIGVGLLRSEIAPIYLPLTIYPDKRYQEEVVPSLTKQQLFAACAVAGTHLHIGTESMEEALAVYNRLAANLDILIKAGDHSNGRRIELYKEVAPNCTPPQYQNLEHFFELALAEGFAANPRSCWHLVRISRHGTVEVRAFGATLNNEEVLSWVRLVRELVKS